MQDPPHAADQVFSLPSQVVCHHTATYHGLAAERCVKVGLIQLLTKRGLLCTTSAVYLHARTLMSVHGANMRAH
jgi:hypothetical protein